MKNPGKIVYLSRDCYLTLNIATYVQDSLGKLQSICLRYRFPQ